MKTALSKISYWLVYIFLACFGIFNLYTPTVLSKFSYAQQDKIDTLLLTYFHEHMYRYFFDATYTASFYTAPFYYPETGSMLLSEINLGVSPIFWFYRGFFDPFLSHQLLPITALIFTYITTIYLLRDLKVNPYLAALGAYVFAFGMMRVPQLGHGQMMNQFYMPLSVLFLFRFIKKPSLLYFNLFAGFAYLQTLAGFYTGYFFVLSLIALLFLIPIFFRPKMLDLISFFVSNKKQTVISSVVWMFLLCAFWGPYALARYGYWKWDTVSVHLPTVVTWLTAPEGTLFYKILPLTTKGLFVADERMLFPGLYVFLGGILLTISLRTIKTVNFENSVIKVSLFTALVLFMLTISIEGYTPWYFLYLIAPGANAIRAVMRIWFVLDFYLIISISLFLQQYIIEKYKTFRFKKIWLVVGVLLYLVFVFEHWVPYKMSFSKNEFNQELTHLKSLISADCTVVFVETEKNNYIALEDNVLAMWASMETDIPTLNGYSSVLLEHLRSNQTTEYIVEEILPKNFKGNFCRIDKIVGTDTYTFTEKIYVDKSRI